MALSLIDIKDSASFLVSAEHTNLKLWKFYSNSNLKEVFELEPAHSGMHLFNLLIINFSPTSILRRIFNLNYFYLIFYLHFLLHAVL